MQRHIFDIFISHKHTEWPFARSLFNSLSSKGYSCWYDADGMHAGNIEQIFQYIDEAKDVIIVINKGNLRNVKTPQWREDFFCREIAYAIEKGKNIIPILLSDIRYLPKVSEMQCEFQNLWKFKYLNCTSPDLYDGLVHYTLTRKGFLNSTPQQNEFIQIGKQEVIISKRKLYMYRAFLVLVMILVSALIPAIIFQRRMSNFTKQDILRIQDANIIQQENYKKLENIQTQRQILTKDSIEILTN